jgi:uncharacterized protein
MGTTQRSLKLNTKQEIEGFVSQKVIAMAGMSRDPKAMSAAMRRELEGKGYRIFAVNPHAATIGGAPCYPDLASLPEKVGGVLVVTAPAQSEKVVRDAAAQGISRVWMQQGAQSPAAEAACREKGLEAVSGKCIMMFAEPVASIHSVHRFVAKVFGQLPR